MVNQKCQMQVKISPIRPVLTDYVSVSHDYEQTFGRRIFERYF